MTSIALCTYNGEQFLRAQLESIAGQTLLPDELVVCDDCSSDNTVAILNEFRDRVPFTVLIHENEENLGSTKNFEKVINLCQGEIIVLCDQDDIWKPHKLETLVETLQRNQEAGYAFSDADLVDEQLSPLGFSLWDSIGFSGDIKDRFPGTDQFKILVMKSIVTGATMAIRSQIGQLATPFPEKLHSIHDGWIALIASSIGARGIPIDETLIQYRQHTNQQIGTAKQPADLSKQSLLGMYRVLKDKQQALFEDWEMKCLRAMQLKEVMEESLKNINSLVLEENIRYLRDFKIHFNNRHKILTSKHPVRYWLILREAFSGRYAQFSDSWRSIFRDLFL